MLRLALAVLLLLAHALPAAAAAALCDAAAARAATATGVPEAVLRAISLTETGRQREGTLQPWPWTVNMEGAGKWFDSAEEALAFVRTHHARGARSYDVGCFQINYRWHGAAFDNVEQMFDPDRNALYAARFLARLHAETGEWVAAAGAYHSRTPKYASRYSARFRRILARVTGGAAPPAPAAPTAPAGGEVALAAAGPLPIDGPLRVSPPSASAPGSLARFGDLPATPLLSAAPGPLY